MQTLRSPSIAILALTLIPAMGCGASTTGSVGSGARGRGAEGSSVDPRSFAQHLELELEVGTLLLGADGPRSTQVALAIEGRAGQLVLFACDWLEARTASEGFPLGPAAYAAEGGMEGLSGMFKRRELLRLVASPSPAFVTCDEVLMIPEASARALGAFLHGLPLEAEAETTTRTISLNGLSLSFETTNTDPEGVLIRLSLEDDSVAIEDCQSLIAMAGGRTFPLADLMPEERRGGRSPQLVGDADRVNVQLLAAAEEAQMIVCAEPWLLDHWALENLSGLVGAPPPGAAPVPLE